MRRSMGLVAMHNKLNEILFAEMLAGKRFVLIVDEAQNLDETVLETIRLLSNFETPHSKLLQIVLAGQSQLEEKLGQKQMAQLLQRITMVKHLEALSPEETAGYVRHRLKVAGHCGAGLFEPEALGLVAERSEGVPRNINKICFRALFEGYARGRHTVSADLVEKATRKLEIVAAARPGDGAGSGSADDRSSGADAIASIHGRRRCGVCRGSGDAGDYVQADRGVELCHAGECGRARWLAFFCRRAWPCRETCCRK